MAYSIAQSLVVLTLLQLCRAEISNTLSESWFSANVIHDGFQPKPLSEIFSTPPAFSSTNPIVVLPNSSPASNENPFISTVSPPSILLNTESSEVFSNYPMLPSSLSTLAPETLSTRAQFGNQEFQPTLRDFTQQTELSSPQITQQTLPPSTPLFQPETQQSTITLPQNIQRQTTVSIPQSAQRQSTVSIPPPTPTQSSTVSIQPIQQQRSLPENPLRFDLGPIAQLMQRQPGVPRDIVPNDRPNYFLIYQQAPQYVQGEGISSSQEVPLVTTPQPVSSTVQPTRTTSQNTLSTTVQPIFSSSIQPAFISTPESISTSQPTIVSSMQSITPSTPGSTVIIQPSSTFSPTRTIPPTISTSFKPKEIVTRQVGPNCTASGSDVQRYPLQIRVVAPKGSITNVLINRLTTTTKKPTTTRTRKPKRNTYDSCVDGCKGNRKPICARPLSTTVIDTETLKGFPSVCHMACHNSYRKEAYEQLLEGRCSLLRTRIRTVDSKTKLKRDDLNKAQYFVDDGPKTVIEFTSALHK